MAGPGDVGGFLVTAPAGVPSATERREALRSALRSDALPVVALGVSDALSARILEDAGAQALYIGSYAVRAGQWAMPDVGLIGLADMADAVRRLAGVTSRPLVVDGEGGFGERLSVARTVIELERAGASAIHIEDHVLGKHTQRPVRLVTAEELERRIALAVDARRDESRLVIGRSDGLNAGEGLDQVVERLQRCVSAGADAVMLAGATPDLVAQVRDRLGVPVVITSSPGWSLEQERECGVSLVLHYGFSTWVASRGLRRMTKSLLDGGPSYREQAWAEELGEVDRLTRLPEWLRFAGED